MSQVTVMSSVLLGVGGGGTVGKQAPKRQPCCLRKPIRSPMGPNGCVGVYVSKQCFYSKADVSYRRFLWQLAPHTLLLIIFEPERQAATPIHSFEYLAYHTAVRGRWRCSVAKQSAYQ